MKDINILKDNGVNVDQGLEILGDMDMYDETLNDFLDEIQTKLDNLKNYKNANDAANYAVIAHSIKSDSKYLGFTKLAELALNHELKGKENDIDYINSNYEELVTEVNRIIDVVKKYLD